MKNLTDKFSYVSYCIGFIAPAGAIIYFAYSLSLPEYIGYLLGLGILAFQMYFLTKIK